MTYRGDIAATRTPLAADSELVEAVAEDGSPTFWIARTSAMRSAPEAATPDGLVHGDASPASAPHDQLGPLPSEWRMRLLGVRYCGRPTSSGTPCRNTGNHPDGACRWHTKRADERTPR